MSIWEGFTIERAEVIAKDNKYKLKTIQSWERGVDIAAAEKYMTQAIERCGETDWEDCSKTKLLELADRLDRHSIFFSEEDSGK